MGRGVHELEPAARLHLTGSYRRGKTAAHDIDVLIILPEAARSREEGDDEACSGESPKLRLLLQVTTGFACWWSRASLQGTGYRVQGTG